jgi:hypothetical protein
MNNKGHYKDALKRYINTHSLYSVDDILIIRNYLFPFNALQEELKMFISRICCIFMKTVQHLIIKY